MPLEALNHAVGRFMRDAPEAEIESGVPGLSVYECRAPTPIDSKLYQPAVCLSLQGAKEISFGAKTKVLSAGCSIIVSHDLPVSSQVTEASPSQPYRALVVELDLSMLRSLYDQVGGDLSETGEGDVIEIARAGPAFVDALSRYFSLIDNQAEATVMAPLIRKELHYRLLVESHGGMLRRLLRLDSRASRIGRAIAHLRANYRQTLAVADLAKAAGMSASTFHAHFREITGTTPLQYQKELRLLEARRLLTESDRSVSATAFEVGYESPTQFSREYSRKFGVTPRDQQQRLEARRA